MIAMKELKIGNLIAKLPIVQGGMGIGVSLSGLASAVSNQGGIGVISAACIGFREPDFVSDFLGANIRALKKEIRKARALTRGILGVNIMVAMSNFSDMVKTAVEEGIDIIFCGAGLPLNLPEFLSAGSRTKLVPIVSSARAAKLIAKKWIDKYHYVPDAMVVEGPLAGGHLGFQPEQLSDPQYSLERLVTEVTEALRPFEAAHARSIPVIAAGGIYSGEDIYRLMALGAAGVQMGTHFVATEECDAAMAFKLAYVNARQGDIGIIKSPVGMPGRAIMNDFIRDMMEGGAKPRQCPLDCIKTCDHEESPYCISAALIHAQRGHCGRGLLFAGENAHRVREILTVKELVELLTREYVAYGESIEPVEGLA